MSSQTPRLARKSPSLASASRCPHLQLCNLSYWNWQERSAKYITYVFMKFQTFTIEMFITCTLINVVLSFFTWWCNSLCIYFRFQKTLKSYVKCKMLSLFSTCNKTAFSHKELHVFFLKLKTRKYTNKSIVRELFLAKRQKEVACRKHRMTWSSFFIIMIFHFRHIKRILVFILKVSTMVW